MTALYNVSLIKFQMQALGFDEKALAKAAGISLPSAYMVTKGVLGTLNKLKAVADALRINWIFITNTDLPEKEFHRAVLTNGDRRVRSVKPGSQYVGVRRPRA